MLLTRYRKLNNESGNNMRLLVSGFGLQKVMPVDSVVDLISALPCEHIARIKVIKFDPNKNVSFLLRHARVGSQLGEYLTAYDSIVIYQFSSPDECCHVLLHEIGHHVYFRFIASQIKKQWVTEIYRSESPVSEVGKRNACEDFAESYALFLTRPELLKKTPQKYQFIKKLFP